MFFLEWLLWGTIMTVIVLAVNYFAGMLMDWWEDDSDQEAPIR